MINEKEVIKYTRRMPPNVWHTPKELQAVLKISTALRRTLVPHMTKRNMISIRGKTANIQYRRRNEKEWLLKSTTITPQLKFTGEIKPTGNGVIDAKLRKEAGVPESQVLLNNLINAATEIGAENAILRQALCDIDASISKVRGYL